MNYKSRLMSFRAQQHRQSCAWCDSSSPPNKSPTRFEWVPTLHLWEYQIPMKTHTKKNLTFVHRNFHSILNCEWISNVHKLPASTQQRQQILSLDSKFFFMNETWKSWNLVFNFLHDFYIQSSSIIWPIRIKFEHLRLRSTTRDKLAGMRGKYLVEEC